MRIIHVSPTYFDEASVIGGGERYVHELAKFQAKCAGNHVSVFSFGPEAKSFLREGVHYRIFKAFHWGQFRLNNPFSLRPVWPLRQANVVHVHQLCTFVSDLAALVGRLWRVPIVGTDHGGGGAWVLNTRLPIYKCYQKVVAQSQQAAAPLRRHFEGRIEVIPGGVDPERFAAPESAYEKRREILFVGRLLPHKGVDLLIQSFKQLNRPGWKLRIVGRPKQDDYFARLKELAAGHAISIETGLDDDAVIHAYQQARVTVLPSQSSSAGGPAPELMGFTVLEAQACGSPVVCSDAGPMREFIEEGKTGWVFKAGDGTALVEALNLAIEASEADLPELSRRCRAHGTSYSWSRVAGEHLNSYRTLITPEE